MSESSDHLDPKEATEARLCAYLEGTLTPTERVEIERHLVANPQHKRLLAELATTREWTRMLPFENVPIDLAEAFQGQVERSLLLDDSDTQGAQVNRWPQVMLIAATILLTLGLGILIYAMLPGRGLSPLASKYGPTSQPFEPEPAATSGALGQPGTPPVPKPMAMRVRATIGSGGRGNPADALASAAPLEAASDHTIVLTISTDQPDQALRQADLFFRRNAIVAEPQISDFVDANSLAKSSRNQQRNQYAQNNAGNYQNQQILVPAVAEDFRREWMARRISPTMVAALKTELTRQDFKRVIAESTTRPVESLAKGDSLNVTVPELIGPGIEKSNVVKVADDGTVTLPMIDPVPAEGLSAAALAASVAEKYRQANLIPQATVTVTPATQPTTKDPTATTQPADGSVDVIVRVRPIAP